MENKTILSLAAVTAVGVALLASKKEDKPDYTTITTEETEPNKGDFTMANDNNNGNSPMSIANVKAALEPKVSKREDWANKYSLYLNQNGGDISLAMALIWQDWVNSPFFDLFPNIKALFFNLATYIPDRTKGISKEDSIGTGTNTIKWNDAPIYEDLYCVWDCGDYWTCADWRAWHRALEQHFGDTYKANDIWMAAWQDPQNQCAVLASVWCPDTDGCRYDCDFVEYFYSKGITIGNVLSNVYCDVSSVVLDIVQTTSNVSSAVSNISEGVKETSTLFKTALPILGGITAVAIGTKIWNAQK